MKTNFKKILSVLLVCVMLASVFSVSVFAADADGVKITLAGGYRSAGKVTGDFNATYDAIEGTKKTTTARGEIFAYSTSGGATTLAKGAVYYEFKRIIDGVEYTFTYTLDNGEKKNESVYFYTDASGFFVHPVYFFDMPGYEDQNGWGNSRTSNSTGNRFYEAGETISSAVTRATTYYGCYGDQEKYTASFLPGALGEGAVVSESDKTYGSTITLKGAIFTRENYAQIGWSTTENSSVAEYSLEQKNVKITSDITFYPVWQEVVYDVKHDAVSFNFGDTCIDYSAPAAQSFTITNNSNAPVTLTLPQNPAYKVTASGNLKLDIGSSVVISIQPEINLPAGKYETELEFDFGVQKINFKVSVKFSVKDHMFIRYTYNNDATYLANGTETAKCHAGCGAIHSQEALNTMKVFSVDNNTADGLLKEYLYHKTVNFVAYGSGMDYSQAELDFAIANNVEIKRFRPVSWYVNDTFNGEFTPETTDYTVKYAHSDYGQFTLEIKYVEEQYVDGEWVATGVEDAKSFNYSIGPSEDDIQNIEMPKTIVSIIFGLMAYLIEAVSGLLG